MVTERERLAAYVTGKRVTYDVLRDTLARGSAAAEAVDSRENGLAGAVVAVGARDAGAFAPLVDAAIGQVAELDRTEPDALQPNLAVLDVLGQLQVMGLAVPVETVRTAANWLAGMQTAGIEPEWMHWTRGLAALALGDLRTARTIAALPADDRADDAAIEAEPEWNVQAWFALLVVSVDRALPWPELAPRWDELLLRFPTFDETRVLAVVDLPWLGRIAGHLVAGVPLGEVADWLHAELHRVAGLSP